MSEAAELRAQLDALRSRRAVRLALLLSGLLRRPRDLLRLPRLLADALRSAPASTATTGGRKVLRLPAPARRRRHPHLRVARLGASPYTDLAAHVDVAGEEALDERADLLYLAAPAPASLTASARELGVPVVAAADGHDRLDALTADGPPDLLVTDEPDVATAAIERLGTERVLRLLPATDLRRCNPVGWIREPERHALLVVAREPTAPAAAWVEEAAGTVDDLTVLLAPGLDPASWRARLPDARVEPLDPAALPAEAKPHRVALAHPGLHASPAAHARHVLDLLACGTPTLHPPDEQLARLLPEALRSEAVSPADVAERLAALADPDDRELASVALRRHVLAHHTTARRFDEVLARLGVPLPPTPTISVLLCTNRPELLDHAHEQIARQQHPSLQIITVCHGEGFEEAHLERLAARHPHPTTMLHAPGHWPLGDALNLALDHATGELVTKMDDDDHYGPHHLTDLVLALEYSRADVVGKLANFVHLSALDETIDRYLERQESFVWHLPGATMLTHRELLAAYRFSRVPRAVDTTLYERLHRDGARRYSTHRFGFVRHRGDQHTYARSDDEFLAQAVHRYPGLPRDRTEL